MRLKYRHAILAMLASSTMSQSAFADGFDVRQFYPAAGPESVFTVESTKTQEHIKFDVRLYTDYANTPLQFDTYEGETASLDHLVSMNLAASMGILDILEVGIVVPFVAYEGYNDVYDTLMMIDVPRARTGVLGDMQLRVKGTILKREDYNGFGLGAGVIMTMPTGKQSALIGSPSVTGRPYIAADYEIGPVEMMLNAGFTFRKKAEFLDYTLTHAFNYGFGIVYHAVPEILDVKGEIFGETPLSSVATEDHHNSAEWMAGLKVMTPIGLDITAGAGTGIGDGVRNPKVRALFGLEYTPRFSDADEDGIRDGRDLCPTVPGAEEFDGCPNPDTDNDDWCDGWVDTDELASHFECARTDRCPELDGEITWQGCPNPDPDQDGWCSEFVADEDMAQSFGCKLTDACSDVTGEDDFNGCPNPDSDSDGWCDSWITSEEMATRFNCKLTDECPNHAGLDENNGCPDADADGDGICAPFVEELGIYDKFFCSGKDACPDDPEDFDDFEDEDGCPDPDNDGDGICDPWVAEQGLLEKYSHVCRLSDQCPNEAEIINGVKDEDGCPDKGKQLVIVHENNLEIKDKIYFNTNKSTIQKKSNALLDQLAQTILSNPSISKLSVEGHTDDTGKYERNIVLSSERAQAVVDALIKRGVPADKLSAKGWGPDKPLDDSKTKAARALNRRVEFIITERH